MTRTSPFTIGGRLAVIAALVLVTASVSVTYLVLRPTSPSPPAPADAAASRRAPVVETPRGATSDDQPGSARSSMTDRASVQTSRQIVVPISRDTAERAGILVE